MVTVWLTLLTVPVVSLYLTVHAVHWTHAKQGASRQAGRTLRSHRNCRHIYSLPAGTAAIAADRLYSLLSWLTQQTQLWGSSNTATLSGAHTGILHKVSVTEWVPRDGHVQCYKWSQLLHNHYLQNVWQGQEAMGQESLTVPSWLICSFPMAIYSSILPGKVHGQRSLVGFSPWDVQRVSQDWATEWPSTLAR